MKAFLKSIARRFGYDIVHLPTNPISRQWRDLLNAYEINLVFDVGANAGQFGKRIRRLGYTGQIVSFEPTADAYRQLMINTASENKWSKVQTALGNYCGEIQINVSANSYSSSVLPMLPLHIESAPDAVYTSTESVTIKTIDSIIDKYYNQEQKLYIKIDTQGFERQVFEGCLKSLDKIIGFQMELSLTPLYEGETLMTEMIDLLSTYGYKLKLLEAGHRNYETGEILQVEGYFFR
ncbi:FkbM family methyltransferase [Nostoc sp. CHAB 5834]|nr:FkbM family methyltransferase [Nostoc sp. CHAB 5834]